MCAIGFIAHVLEGFNFVPGPFSMGSDFFGNVKWMTDGWSNTCSFFSFLLSPDEIPFINYLNQQKVYQDYMEE